MRYAAAVALCLGLWQLPAIVPSSFQARAQPAATGAVERAYRANNIGVAHLEQFDYGGAERAFREALKLHPDLALARLNLAIALFYGGRAADAASEARAAAKQIPDVPQTHYVLGLAARGEDNLDEAVAAFERVLKLDPVDAGAKIQLGQIFLQQRRYEDALRLFQQALESEPYNVTAAYSVALALTRSGKPEEGRTAMQRFETLRDSPYGFTYAQTYLAQGKYAEALASTGAEPELVSPAVPEVTFSDATSVMVPVKRTGAAGSGTVTLFDADGDGDLDLLEVDAAGLRLLRNTNGVFVDDTARAGLGSLPSAGTAGAAVAGDFDNDGHIDLAVAAGGGLQLLRQKAEVAFETVIVQPLSSSSKDAPPALAAADVDHDGDLDLLLAGHTARLFRNNGNGTFTDIAAAAGLAELGSVSAIAPTDFDNRRDIDFIVMTGAGPVLYRNMRDGTFRDTTTEAGLPARGSYGALAAGDINKDGYIDVFVSRTDADGILSVSDGRLQFRAMDAPAGTRGAFAAQFADYDNDGLLDLITADRRSVRIFRQAAGTWRDVTAPARLPVASAADAGTIEAFAVGDLDSDGDADLVMRHAGSLRILKNEGGNRNASLRVQLTARVSNRTGVGAKVEMRAGSLRQMLESSSSSPPVAPADLLFGLGSRPAADVVRVLWPSGILQAETALDAATSKGTSRAPLTVTELDRKPSSCPYLFTWNGSRFEFVTDFMGGGEMGAWLGDGVWNQPDPDEYVRIRGDQLQPRNGSYELRLTNELEEALFYDRAQLVAIDHPAGFEVYPNEGLRSPPRPPFALTAVRDLQPPVRVIDQHGHDVRPQIAALDRQYPDDFALLPIRGYAEPHALVLDLGGAARNPVLLLTGWTDYAFSNDNVAASHAQITMSPPSLQVRDRTGSWRTVIEEIGFPVGRPQTVVVPLAGTFLSPSREVRILTNMRVYWDQILVGEAVDPSSARLTRLEPLGASLRWRGFSAEETPDGREPYGYQYERVSSVLPWKVLAGRYTREGDVRPLLRRVDDLFVISQPGDEIALAFEALPPVAAGRRRTFLLYVHGYSKEMNPRSALPDTVGPLPFRAMTGYPYASHEHYPRSRQHREYQDRYNTRVVTRSVPSIDRVPPTDGRGSGL